MVQKIQRLPRFLIRLTEPRRSKGLNNGKQTPRDYFTFASAKRAASRLESAGKDDLNFSINVLILGKTGVGKSATINSIFGEEKTRINAFDPTTRRVEEITGAIDGVNVRVLDTRGLKSSVMEQSSNKKMLFSVKKFIKRCPPDIVLYVDRLDNPAEDSGEVQVLRSISDVLGSSIWDKAIVALTHAASAPPDGPNGSPLSYEDYVARRSYMVQLSIRRAAAGDGRRPMSPVALVENYILCRKRRGKSVLPDGQIWRLQLLFLCYSSKILSEAYSVLKLQGLSTEKLSEVPGQVPLPLLLLRSLLQSRAHPKLKSDLGDGRGIEDSDIDQAESSGHEEGEEEYDELKEAYFDEYEYRIKLLRKKQRKEELRILKELQKREKEGRADFEYKDRGEDSGEEDGVQIVAVPGNGLKLVAVPPRLRVVIPPSFDGDNPDYRYRFVDTKRGLLRILPRPVLDSPGCDRDCGYGGISFEESLDVANQFPAFLSLQFTKDKKEFNIDLDASVSAVHGDIGSSSLAGIEIQSVGKELAYLLRGETRFKNWKLRNATTGGISVAFLGKEVAAGVKIEDEISIGKRFSLVGTGSAMRVQGEVPFGINLEARLRGKDYPIDRGQSSISLSLMRWRGDLAFGLNSQSLFETGRNSTMSVQFGLHNNCSGKIAIRASSKEQLHLSLLGLLPFAFTILDAGSPVPFFWSWCI